MPTATIAMFSTLKYIAAPTLEQFRTQWKATYLNGFVIHSKVFDGLNGDFPICFLIWATNQNDKEKTLVSEIEVEVLNKAAKPVGMKIFSNTSKASLLTDWITRPEVNNEDALPLKNAVTPATASKDLRGTKWSDGAIAWLNCAGNDLQNAAQKTFLLSSGYGSGRGFFVNENNLAQAAVVFSVRRLIKPTWLNDRDQFLQPKEQLTEDFKTDCLIWMLFSSSNLTAGANDLEWNGKTWSLVNHFIPFTETEVGAPERFESDFMNQYLACKKLTTEAQAVLDAGRTLWQAYFAHTDERSVREDFKLNRSDAGWYQIRNALKARNSSSQIAPVSFETLEQNYEILTDKLRPQVFSLGFLR